MAGIYQQMLHRSKAQQRREAMCKEDTEKTVNEARERVVRQATNRLAALGDDNQIRGVNRAVFVPAGAIRERAKHMRLQADGLDTLANMFDAAEKMGTPPHQLEAAYWTTLPR